MLRIEVGVKRSMEKHCLLAIIGDGRASIEESHLKALLCVSALVQHTGWHSPGMSGTSTAQLFQNPRYPGFVYMAPIQTGKLGLLNTFYQRALAFQINTCLLICVFLC